MDFAGEKVLVTGGAGFIGTRLVRELVRAGAGVRVLDDLSTGSLDGLGPLVEDGSVEFIRGSITDEGACMRACDGMRLVMHLAVLNLRACMTRPHDAVAINAAGTLNVCLAAAAAGASRLVYVSSSDIYGDVDEYPTPEAVQPRPTTMYGITKLAGEHIAQTYHASHGLETVIVRPFNTYGPGEHVAGDSGEVLPRFILYALSGLPLPVYGDGSQTRSFTYIDDTVRGIMLAAGAAEPPEQPVNIASGREVTVLEAARMVIEETGSASGIEHLAARPGDVARQLADTSAARRLLGFEAATPIRDGLARLVEWVRETGVTPGHAPRLWPGC